MFPKLVDSITIENYDCEIIPIEYLEYKYPDVFDKIYESKDLTLILKYFPNYNKTIYGIDHDTNIESVLLISGELKLLNTSIIYDDKENPEFIISKSSYLDKHINLIYIH